MEKEKQKSLPEIFLSVAMPSCSVRKRCLRRVGHKGVTLRRHCDSCAWEWVVGERSKVAMERCRIGKCKLERG